MRMIMFASVLILTLSSALYWSNVPLVPAHGESGDCASCHAGSVLSNHTDAFIRTGHGQSALDDRQSCMGCHATEGCNDCHLSKRPEWHNEAFCNPGGSPKNRDEHLRGAAARSGACMECHAARFHMQCSECHIRDEWPR